MANSPITPHQFSPGNALSAGVTDHTAVPPNGTADKPVPSASGALNPAVERVAEMAHRTVDKVAAAAAPTAAWLAAQGDSLAADQRTAVGDARSYASANPWQSLGLALAAGFLLGRLSR